MVQSNAKKGNAFGRLFKSKKKASLSSQGMELRADDNTAGEEFLLNDSSVRKSGKSKFRRSRSKQDPTLISTRYSDKKNQKSTSTAKTSASLSRSEETHPTEMYALSKEQVVTSSPQQSQFQPFYNFDDTHFDDDPAIFHKKSGASLVHAPSDETGDSFTNNPFNHKNDSMPASPKSPLSFKSKDSATASTPDAGFLKSAFEDAWSVFCTETNATSNVQKNSETEVANRLQVRVDVLQNLQMSEHDSVDNYDNESLDSGQKARKTDLLVLIRSALSRPFGRTSLPAHLAKTWVVEVTSAGFDKSRNMCNYNIMVQKEEYNDVGTPIPSPLRSTFKNKLSLGTSFVAASIDRTLQDFLWLEEALRKEYHGSLIFPILSLALTSGTDWTMTETFDKESFAKGEWDPLAVSIKMLDDAVHSNERVDVKLLAGWFSDVLNSVRGKGELILDHNFMDVDIIHSQAIESFLYKTLEPLPNPSCKKWGKSNASDSNWLLGDLKKALNFQETGQDDISSTLAGLVKANLQCLGIMDDDNLGYGNNRHADDSDSLVLQRTKTGEDQENAEMWRGLIQSNGLRAQRFYIAVQQENTLRTMYQLRMLLERESLLSAAWKRFAISLSMLFAAEKDVEICKLEGSKPSSSSNPSRVGKTQVDENLRILARQKVDRSVPSLKVLSGMLNTYYADFSSVDPSLREYAEGVENLIKANMDGGWQSQLKAMSPMNLLNVGNHESSSNQHQYKADKYAMQERLSTNEEYMKSSIMQLCKAMKIRISRMGWKYFKMESGQVSLLLTSAEQVRSNLKSGRIRDASIMENEQSDNEKEAELVRVIMELGLKRKYKYQSVPKSSSSSHTSSETSSVISDFDKSHEGDNDTLTTDDGGTIQSPLLESVMTVAREHSGRWNADVSEKILQGSGIPYVRMDVDDKSKSLRLVSKLARALKESIDRCKDAVQLLKQVNIQVRLACLFVVSVKMKCNKNSHLTFSLLSACTRSENSDRAVTS
jgi:hypothetical protein